MAAVRISRIPLRWMMIVSIMFPLLAQTADAPDIKRKHVQAAEQIIGLSFNKAERDSLLRDLVERQIAYEQLRSVWLPNAVSPALLFNPIPVGRDFDTSALPVVYAPVVDISRPADLNELAYATVAELGELEPAEA